MTASNVLSQLGSPGVSTGFKNRIINGAMVIDQRNAGASISATSTSYSADRWRVFASQVSKFTAQQLSASPPVGFTNYVTITSSSAYSITSTDIFKFSQVIEANNTFDLGWGTVNAQTITLSFWVKSSLTGTFGGSLLDANGAPSYPFTYSIPVANTWTKIIVTVPGPTTGTWNTGNTGFLEVMFGLGVGSTYSGTAGSWQNANYQSATGATSIVGTNGATWSITGVQLEVGTTATNFEVRSYGNELALCQRYYYYDSNQDYIAPPIDSGTYSAYRVMTIPFSQSMRTSPTVTYTQNGSITSITPSTKVTVNTIYLSWSGVSNNFVQITNLVASAEF